MIKCENAFLYDIRVFGLERTEIFEEKYLAYNPQLHTAEICDHYPLAHFQNSSVIFFSSKRCLTLQCVMDLFFQRNAVLLLMCCEMAAWEWNTQYFIYITELSLYLATHPCRKMCIINRRRTVCKMILLFLIFGFSVIRTFLWIVKCPFC